MKEVKTYFSIKNTSTMRFYKKTIKRFKENKKKLSKNIKFTDDEFLIMLLKNWENQKKNDKKGGK